MAAMAGNSTADASLVPGTPARSFSVCTAPEAAPPWAAHTGAQAPRASTLATAAHFSVIRTLNVSGSGRRHAGSRPSSI